MCRAQNGEKIGLSLSTREWGVLTSHYWGHVPVTSQEEGVLRRLLPDWDGAENQAVPPRRRAVSLSLQGPLPTVSTFPAQDRLTLVLASLGISALGSERSSF